MSTKTIYKRIALVAVASLGAGVLSVAPANAATINITSTVVATTTPVSTTIATPSAVGTAITATVNVVQAAISTTAVHTIGATYVLTDPNGEVVTSSATFASTATSGGVTATNTGAVYAFSIAISATAATKPVGTVTFTPKTAGVYVLTYSTVNTTLATDSNTPITNGNAASFYVSGSGAKVASSGIGTTTIGAITGGQAQVRFGTAAHTSGEIYNVTSSGVGTIQTIADGASGAGALAGIAATTDFTQGAKVTTTANTDFNDVLVTVASTVAGTQTLTWTSISATTGAPTVVATQAITWGATPAVSVASTTARVNAGTGVTANGTDTAILVSKSAANQQANIVVTVRDAAGAALMGQIVSATIAGPGLIAASATATAAVGTARVATVTLSSSVNIASIHVNADGTSGTGVITITVGTTVVATKTVYFYDSPATVTVVQNHKVLDSAGAVAGIAAAANAGTGADIANTPAVILTVLDKNGIRVLGLSTTTVSAVVSDATVLSSTITMATSDGTGAANTVSGTYNVQVGSAPKASGSTATMKFKVVVSAASGTFIESAPITYTLGGSVATVAFSLNKAIYTPGEAATATLTVKDSAGNSAKDGDHVNITAAALSSSLGITGSLVFGAGGTTVSSLGGVAVAKVNAPGTSGTWTVSGTTGTGPSVAAEKNKALTATATVSSSADISAITTLVNSLIAKINALAKLVAKIDKKVRA